MKKFTKLKLFNPVKAGLVTAALMLLAFAGFATNVTFHLIDHGGNAITDATAIPGWNAGTWNLLSAVDGSGTETISLTPGSYYFNMKYNNYTQQVGPITVTGTAQDVTFQTTLVTLQLTDHLGNPVTASNAGTGGYNTGTWYTLGGTGITGTVSKELLPGGGYFFNMNYNYYTQQIGSMAVTSGGGTQTIPFQTTLVKLHLENHAGAAITDLSGTGGYNTGLWYTIGATDASGVCEMELLPGTGYFFNMNYHNYTQQIGSTSVTTGVAGVQDITFQTTLVSLNLQHHDGIAPITDGSGTGGYNTGSWHTLGSTDVNGACEIELLPGTGYYFNMNYNNYTQQVGSMAVNSGGGTQSVPFRTTLVSLNLVNHLGAPITDGSGTGGYNTGAWHTLGATNANGTCQIELLQGTGYYFNMAYSNQTQQIGSTSVNGSPWTQNVPFQTVLATVNLTDCSSGPSTLINTSAATVQYNTGAWHNFGPAAGAIAGGTVSQELLPGPYYFNMTYNHGYAQQGSLTINAANPTVNFSTTKVTFSGGTVQYNQGTWNPFTITGMNLLPGNYYFSVNGGPNDYTNISGCSKTFNVAPCSGPTGITAEPISCGGTILIAPAGATYSWSGPAGFTATTQTIFANTTAVYAVDVTYDFTCSGAAGGTTTYTSAGTTSGTRTVTVRLQDHLGNGIAGATVQSYVSGTWTTSGTTGSDGNVCMAFPTTSPTSIRVMYHGGTQQWNSVSVASNPGFIATTTTVSENLENNTGSLITDNTATVGYYGTAWVTTALGASGSQNVELLPGSYYFNMKYHNFTQQVGPYSVSGNTYTQNFQTTLVSLNLNNHNGPGNLITAGPSNGGYYSGGWYLLGSNSAGTSSVQLLPGSYYFNMCYNHFTQQTVPTTVNSGGGTQPIDFVTTLVSLNLNNHNGVGNLITGETSNGGYYSGGWYLLGANTAGTSSVELLPGSYYFNMNYNHFTQQTTPTIVNSGGGTQPIDFITKNVSLNLNNHNGAGNLIVGESSKGGYYSGGWYYLTPTPVITGTSSIELLPGSYYFNMCYNHFTQQTVPTTVYCGGGDTAINFQTTLVSVNLKDCDNNTLINTSAATANFYSGGWYPLPAVSDGATSIELLAGSYYFNMTYNYGSEQQGALSVNAGGSWTQNVDFNTTKVTFSDPVTGTISYYQSGWHTFTPTGMNLLPGNYYFQVNGGPTSSIRNISGCAEVIHIAPCTPATGITSTVGGCGGSYELTAPAGGSYSWSGPGVTGETAQSILVNTNGTYSVTVTYDFTCSGGAGSVNTYSTTVSGISTTNTVTIRLQDSKGNGISGATVQYYNGGWQSFGTTGTTDANGNACMTFATPISTSFEVLYAGGTKEWSGIAVADNPLLVAQTTDVSVNLLDHSGAGISGGIAQYYSGGWLPIGTTDGNGSTSKELLPGSYPFNMTYNFATQQISFVVDAGPNDEEDFQTSLVTASLVDHSGAGLSGGTAQFYSGGYHSFVSATDGSGNTTVELLPGSYPFVMGYNYATQQISYTVAGTTSSAPFQTSLVTASLVNHSGAGLSGGTAQFYSGGYHPFATATDGSGNTTVELLPGSYPFVMSYNFGSQQISDTVAGNTSTAPFQTSLVTASLKDHSGSGLSGGTAQFYSGGYHSFATATDGSGNTTVELLPGSYPFVMGYNFGSQQISYTVSSTASSAPFQTSTVTVSLADHSNTVGAINGDAQFYSGGWHDIGTTSGGIITTELLPGSYPFNMTYNYGTQQVSYPVSGATSSAPFQTALVTIHFQGNTGIAHAGAAIGYYSGGWHSFDNLTDASGNSSMEMLPVSLTYNATLAGYGTTQSPSYYTDASGTTPTHIIQSSSAARQAAPGAGTVANTSFTLFPNPATDKITIQYSSVNNAQATVQVTDIAGKVIMDQTFESVSGANTHDLDMSSLPSGMYMIMFSNEGNNEVRKINVLH